MTQYAIQFYETDGTLLDRREDFISLRYGIVLNDVGYLEVDFDQRFDPSFLHEDIIMEIYRKPIGVIEYLEGERLWYVRSWSDSVIAKTNRHSYKIIAFDANHLLKRRIINAPEGSAGGSKVQPADNMIKAYCREALGSLASAARDMRPYLDIAANSSLAMTVRYTGEHTNLLDTCKAITEKVAGYGNFLAFDCVRVNPGQSVLRTYTNQRGINHGFTSGDIRLFGVEFGNLINPILEDNHTNTVNYIYALGAGREDAREVVEVYDTTSIRKSALNRHEAIYNCAGLFRETAQIEAMGYRELGRLKDRRRLTGQLVDLPYMRYGIDYFWGDKVAVQYGSYSFDCHIKTVEVSYSGGIETVTISVEGEA